MTSRWLTPKQAGEIANLSEKTIRRMLNDGRLRGDRTTDGDHGHWRVDPESIDEWFMRSEKKAIVIARSLKV